MPLFAPARLWGHSGAILCQIDYQAIIFVATVEHNCLGLSSLVAAILETRHTEKIVMML